MPSTYLWHKSIEDLHVNSLWQRIRQSLLLYLQLLICYLVIFALLRPGWRSGQLSGGRYIFLIDNSASMNATDVAPSRLAEAKRQTLTMIDEMHSGDHAMVISFSDVARVEQGWTDNRRDLRRAIENIQPTHRPTSIDEALRTAAGWPNPTRTTRTKSQKRKSKPAESVHFQRRQVSAGRRLFAGKFGTGVHAHWATDVDESRNRRFQRAAQRRTRKSVGGFRQHRKFWRCAVNMPVDLLLNGNPIDTSQVQVKPAKRPAYRSI